MKIEPVRMFDNGFMTQSFAFGGEEGQDAFDNQIIYRSSLQNYVIDTGDEIILLDTGFENGFKAPEKKLGAPLYMGEKIADYMDALRALGYSPEQVSKIVVTHKHPDHTNALQYFPNAKIYIGKEDAEAMKLTGENIVTPEFKDGEFYNFPESEKIAENVWMLPAKGHTKGNSIVIVKDGDLFYMIHGDVTYCDAALKANKLSIIFEDKEAARTTLDRVREFIKKHPTVYLSTHCPEGYENLEMKRIMIL